VRRPVLLLAGFQLSDPLFHALGFGLQLLQILLKPGDLLFACDKAPPERRALTATTALAAVASMSTVFAVTALSAVAVMLPVSTVATLSAVTVVMLIMFSHMFHLLSLKLLVSLPYCPF